ncbi:MAG: hypothetical protein KDK44_00445 [Chlamydiia bacterium]|nr:hypothetical protein [Chlamydiia bacterium]MCP5509469.1 hypothetical protein [Chlamydiales bacterium]HPE85686.1 hypothetical protein [Chlamydiales bacterium]
MSDACPLHTALKEQMCLEVNSMRDALSFAHQMEYAILSGDQEMSAQLATFFHETEVQLINIRQKRQEITTKILHLASSTSIDLPTILTSMDEDDCESAALFEQLELLDAKIEDQIRRNDLLKQAVDTRMELPQSPPDDPMRIQAVYSKKKKQPILLAVDFQEDSPQKK